MKHQIFLSYRREGGETLAQLIHDRLSARGYNVFYDIESLSSGPFNTKLYEKIEECEDFILVLPPRALDRCIYDEDWVRCEIRHALKHKKNIIPLLMRGFVFPNDLPNDINAVRDMQGVEFETMEFLDARIDKLASMLQSKKTDDSSASTPSGKPSLIRNVCSLGSCDFDHAFPSDGHFSEIIDRDKYNVVYFHVKVAPINKTKINSQFIIYDSKNRKILEDITDFDWESNYDTIARSWVIRGRDNSFVKTGRYRAEFRIEDSEVFEYEFMVTSEASSIIDKDLPEVSGNTKLKKTTPSPSEKEVSRPKGFLFHLLTSVFVLSALICVANDLTLIALLCFAISAVSYVALIKYTKKYVTGNPLLILLFVVPGFGYYGIYLFVTAVIALVKYPKFYKQVKKQK